MKKLFLIIPIVFGILLSVFYFSRWVHASETAKNPDLSTQQTLVPLKIKNYNGRFSFLLEEPNRELLQVGTFELLQKYALEKGHTDISGKAEKYLDLKVKVFKEAPVSGTTYPYIKITGRGLRVSMTVHVTDTADL